MTLYEAFARIWMTTLGMCYGLQLQALQKVLIMLIGIVL
jgi:hypothetical protein